MIIKRIALLTFVLCSNTIHTEHGPAESIEALCHAIGKKSINIKACLNKHKFLELAPGTKAFTNAVNELSQICERELNNDEILTKQFLVMLHIGRAIGFSFNREYDQAEAFCDMAIALDPENYFAYEIKADCCRQTGNETQALAYEKIAKEKGGF